MIIAPTEGGESEDRIMTKATRKEETETSTTQSRKIVLASARGFCFGVELALNIVNDAIEKYKDKQIYVINEIVHNKTIVEDLEKQGVTFTQDLSNVPNNAIVIYSAHGVTPQVREHFDNSNFVALDATCPIVTKIHNDVNSYSDQGYHVIYIGVKHHDEAQGVIAENPGNISVVESETDIPSIEQGHKRYIVLTQTTLNMDEVEALFVKIQATLPHTEFATKNSICYATTERQAAVKALASKGDLFLVLGSKNSSNSQKLKSIAEDFCANSHLIDNYSEIEPSWLNQVDTICITAGASAPDNLVTDTVEFLKANY